MKISAIVITNRTDAVVTSALESLAAQDHRPLELVLWGNGAVVDPPASLREAGLEVVTGSSPTNLGVAGGRNAAARLATGDALLFLDDDAILQPGALRRAVATLTQAPDVGAVAFRIVDPDTRRTALWLYPLDRDDWEDRGFDAPTFVGCGGLVRRELFERLGAFWPGYFREMEEVDFCWRLMGAGWRIRYEPRAVVEHIERERRIYRYLIPGNLAMMWRLTPRRLALRQAAIKLPLFALRAVRHGELTQFLDGLAATPALLRRAERERAPLDAATVAHLRGLHARGGWGKRAQWSLRPLPMPDLHAS
jgi:GT2 family glycosyltransferase